MSNGYQFQECCGGDDGGDGHGAADDDGDLVDGDDVCKFYLHLNVCARVCNPVMWRASLKILI